MLLGAHDELNDDTPGGRPPSRRPAGIPDRAVTPCALSPGTTAAHGCRLIACVCGPARRPTGQTVQDGAQASIAALKWAAHAHSQAGTCYARSRTVGRLCRAACYEDAFLSAFPKPVLRCVGPRPPHCSACPHNFRVDLTCARAYATLGELHLDHEQDLVVTCDMWVQALAARAPARARNVGRRRRRRATLPPALLGAAGAGVPSPGKCTGVSD